MALLAGGWAQLWLAAQHHRQPPHAKQQYATVYSRAAQICSALSSGCTMDPHPVFSEHRSRFYAGDRTPLRMWKFNCQLDGRPTWLIFNDNTASLCYLIAERPDTLKPESNGVHTIRNRAEAAEAGFQQLKAMKLVGRGMQVALTVPPRINPMGTTWLMTWSVTPDVGAAPYTVRLELDRSNGNPISMADTGSLDAASDTVPHS